MDTSAINSQTNKRFFRQITIDKGRRNRLDSRKRNERKEKEESKKTDQFNLLHIRSTSTVIIQPKWRLPRRRYIIIIIRQSTYRIRKRRFELSWFIITHQIKPLKIRIYVYEYIYIYINGLITTTTSETRLGQNAKLWRRRSSSLFLERRLRSFDGNKWQ